MSYDEEQCLCVLCKKEITRSEEAPPICDNCWDLHPDQAEIVFTDWSDNFREVK